MPNYLHVGTKKYGRIPFTAREFAQRTCLIVIIGTYSVARLF